MRTLRIRPMNVTVRQNTRAGRLFTPEVLAPGIPKTPAHNLVDKGGRTIRSLTYANFYVGGDASWKQTDRDNIDKSLAAAMTDAQLSDVMSQYFSGPIETTFRESRVLSGAKPHLVTKASIERSVRKLQKDGQFKGYELASTVFNFLLPSGTTLQDDDAPKASDGTADERGERAGIPFEEDASSLEGLGGYHGSVHVTAGGQATVYYAVGVFSELLADGRENGIVAFDEPWKNVVATFYHELCEARTDPDVEDVIKGILPESALGWVSAQGEECGDFPVFEAEPNLGKVFKEIKLANGMVVPVQLQYSNRDNGPGQPK